MPDRFLSIMFKIPSPLWSSSMFTMFIFGQGQKHQILCKVENKQEEKLIFSPLYTISWPNITECCFGYTASIAEYLYKHKSSVRIFHHLCVWERKKKINPSSLSLCLCHTRREKKARMNKGRKWEGREGQPVYFCQRKGTSLFIPARKQKLYEHVLTNRWSLWPFITACPK